MNVFELFAKISLDKSEYERDLDDAREKSSSLISNIGNGFKFAAKATVAAVSAASSAIGGLIVASTGAYAEYEQLVGGVQTLFKDSAGIVQEYAENAYRTAGLSANEYMETVTGFSASLLQSLAGDTKAAADYADTAIRDMSDNANKMGASMESIQNAYQGFAKQNYTMLDNLKLGYGGTTSEMYRLLQDAANLNEEFERTSTFSMDTTGHLTAGYDEIIEAIHIVQTEMGISGLTAEEAAAMVEQGVLTQEEAYERMGTTAKEAATTIEGSFNSLKSAWENLVIGFARDDVDLEILIGNLADNAAAYFENILPVAEKALNGVVSFITGIAPVIGQKLPEVINTALPGLINAGASAVNALVEGVRQGAPLIANSAIVILRTLANAIISNLPVLVTSSLEIIAYMASSLGSVASELIPAAVEMLLTLIEGLIDNIDLLVDSAISLINGLAEGLLKALPILIDKAPVIIKRLAEAIIRNAPRIMEAAVNLILMLDKGIVENLPALASAAVDIIVSIDKMLIENAPKIFEAAIVIMLKLAEGLLFVLDDVIETVVPAIIGELIMGLADLAELGPELVNAVKNIMDLIAQCIANVIVAAREWGHDFIINFVNGIYDMFGVLTSALNNVGYTVKQYIGFSEPEKGPLSRFHEFSPDMMQLFAQGIKDNEYLITDQISRSFDFSDTLGVQPTNTALVPGPTIPLLRTTGGSTGRDITIILELDKQQFGRAVYRANNDETQRVGVNLAGGV